MKVFISWSGDKSRSIAELLREWLPDVIQSVEPFISTQDIPAGGRGMNVLASELEECAFGIICLTRENISRPWINFEAGALSKVIAASSVVPLLVDLNPNDLTGPITQFQAVRASSSEDAFKMIRALAQVSAPHISEHRLKRLFDTFWPEFESKVVLLQQPADGSGEDHQVRTDRDLLEEVVTLTRRTERELTRLANVRITEQVLAERRGTINRPQTPWRGTLSRRIMDDILAGTHRNASSFRSWELDDSGFHVIIDIQASDAAELGLLREAFRKVALVHGIPIHVRGEPVGDEIFGD